jgi:predicted helicase
MNHATYRTYEPVSLAPGRVTVLATYANLPTIAAAHRLHGLGACELAVVDEAHRLAPHGAKPWAVIHWDAQIPAVRRLYLTATPRIMTGPAVRRSSAWTMRRCGLLVLPVPAGWTAGDLIFSQMRACSG